MISIDDTFRLAHPKAVDFHENIYREAKEAIDAAALQYGYRLAGLRLARVVFTTKKIKEIALAARPNL